MAFQNISGKPRFYVDLIQFMKACNMIEREYIGYSNDGSYLQSGGHTYGEGSFDKVDEVDPKDSFWGLQDLQRSKRPYDLDNQRVFIAMGIKWDEDYNEYLSTEGRNDHFKRLIHPNHLHKYINYQGVLGHTMQPYETEAIQAGFINNASITRFIQQWWTSKHAIEGWGAQGNAWENVNTMVMREKYKYLTKVDYDSNDWLDKVESIVGTLDHGSIPFFGFLWGTFGSNHPSTGGYPTVDAWPMIPNRHSGSNLVTQDLRINGSPEEFASDINYADDWNAATVAQGWEGQGNDPGAAYVQDNEGKLMLSDYSIGGVEMVFYPQTQSQMSGFYGETSGDDWSISPYGPSLNPRTVNMCGVTMGRHFEMITPNMNVEFSRVFDGIDDQKTNKGISIINIAHTGTPNWGDGNPPFSMNTGKPQSWSQDLWNASYNFAFEKWGLGSNKSKVSRAGRRAWRLKFDAIGNDKLMAAYESLNAWPYPRGVDSDYDANWFNDNLNEFVPEDGGVEGLQGLGIPVGDYKNPLMEDNNFFSQVLLKTMGGQLPFIFQPGYKEPNEANGGQTQTNFNKSDEIAVCTFKRSSFKYKRRANNVYSISFDLEETW